MAIRELPVAHCARVPLGEVRADPEAYPWTETAALPLREATLGGLPQQATWVKTAWNEEEWRVLFYAEDTHVWATHTQRDAPLYEEEVVEVFFDPSGAGNVPDSYFEIEVNPLNAVMDLVLRRTRSGLKKDFAWACEGLRTAVKRHGAASGQLLPGWSAELAIPFASVGAIPRQSRWRVNFCRIDRPAGAPRELSAWSAPLSGTFHEPSRFGILEFAE